MRPLIVLLLALAVAGCDRGKPQTPQPSAGAPDATAASGGGTVPSPAGKAGGKVDRSHAGQPIPDVPVDAPDGTMARFGPTGRPMLINLWATWCAPCLAEMPTLDALAVRDGRTLDVHVVSQDLAGKRAVDPYFAKAGFKALKPYIDKPGALMEALKADTLPVTVLYGADGKERWRVVGGMDWTGAEAKALIDKAV